MSVFVLGKQIMALPLTKINRSQQLLKFVLCKGLKLYAEKWIKTKTENIFKYS